MNGTTRPKRVLIAIAHYYRQTDSPLYGSLKEPRSSRVVTVRNCLTALAETFALQPYLTNLAKPAVKPANQSTVVELSVAICTTGEAHLLEETGLPDRRFKRAVVNCRPLRLGFACHRLLQRQLGNFDFYCYMDDDLIVRDSWLFSKLAWFNQQFEPAALLQPNRFELAGDHSGRKAYIDGDLEPHKTSNYQDITVDPMLTFNYLGQQLVFRRTLNPHAGCFFLSAQQMEDWVRRPYFLDGDCSFYGPLESANALGIMRTFKIYKPAREVADFLEVRHSGDAWLKKIARRDAAVSQSTATQCATEAGLYTMSTSDQHTASDE